MLKWLETCKDHKSMHMQGSRHFLITTLNWLFASIPQNLSSEFGPFGSLYEFMYVRLSAHVANSNTSNNMWSFHVSQEFGGFILALWTPINHITTTPSKWDLPGTKIRSEVWHLGMSQNSGSKNQSVGKPWIFGDPYWMQIPIWMWPCTMSTHVILCHYCRLFHLWVMFFSRPTSWSCWPTNLWPNYGEQPPLVRWTKGKLPPFATVMCLGTVWCRNGIKLWESVSCRMFEAVYLDVSIITTVSKTQNLAGMLTMDDNKLDVNDE